MTTDGPYRDAPVRVPVRLRPWTRPSFVRTVATLGLAVGFSASFIASGWTRTTHVIFAWQVALLVLRSVQWVVHGGESPDRWPWEVRDE